MTAALELETGPSPASVASAGAVVLADVDLAEDGDIGSVDEADLTAATSSSSATPIPANVQEWDAVHALPWHQASPPPASRPAVERRRAAVAATRTLADVVWAVAS